MEIPHKNHRNWLRMLIVWAISMAWMQIWAKTTMITYLKIVNPTIDSLILSNLMTRSTLVSLLQVLSLLNKGTLTNRSRSEEAISKQDNLLVDRLKCLPFYKQRQAPKNANLVRKVQYFKISTRISITWAFNQLNLLNYQTYLICSITWMIQTVTVASRMCQCST